MLLIFFLLFILVPIVEIYVIIQVGQAIGPWWTIGLLIVDSLVGAWLMRSQGRIVWQRFSEALEAGRPPAREVLDGALVIVGGAFALAPGFVTDAVGLFLIAPPTRALVRRFIVARLTSHGAVRLGVWAVGRRPGARPQGPQPYDIEGTVHEEDPTDRPQLP